MFTIPDDKVSELTGLVNDCFSKTSIQSVALASLAGKLNFVAGLIDVLRPFLTPFWATLYSPPQSATSGRRLKGSIAVRRFRHALRRFHAFLTRVRNTITREILLVTPGPIDLHFIVDTSPWGLGSVELLEGTRPHRWYTSLMSRLDLLRFNARIGVSDYNTRWEALAILVALRLWASNQSGASGRRCYQRTAHRLRACP